MGMEIVAMVLTHDRMALVGFVWVLLLCVVTKVIRITPVRTVALMLSGVVFILIAPPTYLERVFLHPIIRRVLPSRPVGNY